MPGGGFFFSFPLCLRFFACFSSGVDNTVVQRKWGQQDPGGICETLKTPTGPSSFFCFVTVTVKMMLMMLMKMLQ